MLRLTEPGWLALAAEHTTEAILVRNQVGRYLWANEAGAGFLARPLNEVLGRLDRELFPDATFERVASEDLHVMESGVPLAFFCRVRKPEGHVDVYAARKLPWRAADGVLGGVIVFARQVGREADGEVRGERVTAPLPLGEVGTWEADLVTGGMRWSPELYSLFGVAPSVAGSFGVMMERTHIDDRSRLVEAIERAKRELVPYEVTRRIVRPDGRLRWVVSRGLPVADAEGRVVRLLGTSQDVTALVEQDAALQASEARHRQLLAHTSDLIFSAAAGERVSYVSPSSRRLLGLEPDELLGTRLLPRLHPDDRQLAWDALAHLRKGAAEATLTVRVRHRDGPWVWFEAKASAIRDPQTGEVLEVLATAREVGERRAREEAERAQLALLREADALKSAFLGMVSHELRTPLHVLMGWQEVLGHALVEGAPERPVEVLGKLREVTSGLARLVDDLLDLSQVQAGTFAVRPAPTDVAAAIAAARAQLAPLATQRALDLDEAVEADLPHVDADPDRLHQVLVNLVGNALKFTPSGGKVTIRARVSRGRVRLAVEDTGVGVAEGDLTRIFEPFVQADMGLTRSAGGVGIGLSICRAIVEAHGGRIRVRSRLGRGSTFEFALRMST